MIKGYLLGTSILICGYIFFGCIMYEKENTEEQKLKCRDAALFLSVVFSLLVATIIVFAGDPS